MLFAFVVLFMLFMLPVLPVVVAESTLLVLGPLFEENFLSLSLILFHLPAAMLRTAPLWKPKGEMTGLSFAL
jgi:hypothetical protein